MTTKSSHHISSKTLAVIFASSARVAVLRVFMLDPLRTYYQRQLESATGMAIRGVQRELERLSSIELLYRHMEGNRAYYKVDMDFPLFPELRSMVLKTCDDLDRLRGYLALEDSLRLAFRAPRKNRVLLVSWGECVPSPEGHEAFSFESLSSAAFERTLSEDPASLETYLAQGEDLLGRRDDIIWRNIESAGFDVKKGEGVP